MFAVRCPSPWSRLAKLAFDLRLIGSKTMCKFGGGLMRKPGAGATIPT